MEDELVVNETSERPHFFSKMKRKSLLRIVSLTATSANTILPRTNRSLMKFQISLDTRLQLNNNAYSVNVSHIHKVVYVLDLNWQFYVTSSKDKSVKIWDKTTHSCVKTLHINKAIEEQVNLFKINANLFIATCDGMSYLCNASNAEVSLLPKMSLFYFPFVRLGKSTLLGCDKSYQSLIFNFKTLKEVHNNNFKLIENDPNDMFNFIYTEKEPYNLLDFNRNTFLCFLIKKPQMVFFVSKKTFDKKVIQFPSEIVKSLRLSRDKICILDKSQVLSILNPNGEITQSLNFNLSSKCHLVKLPGNNLCMIDSNIVKLYDFKSKETTTKTIANISIEYVISFNKSTLAYLNGTNRVNFLYLDSDSREKDTDSLNENPSTRMNKHTSYVTCLTKIDIDKFASASRDSLIYIWNLSNNTNRTLSGHKGSIFCLSKIGHDTLASSGEEGGSNISVFIWNISSGTIVLKVFTHIKLISLFRLEKGKICGVSKSYDITCWETTKGKQTLNFRPHYTEVSSAIRITNDIIAVASSGVYFTYLKETRQLAKIDSATYVNSLVLFDGGRLLAGDDDGRILIISMDIERGHYRLTNKCYDEKDAWPVFVLLKHNSNAFISGTQRNIKLWNINTYECIRTIGFNMDLLCILRLNLTQLAIGGKTSEISIVNLVE